MTFSEYDGVRAGTQILECSNCQGSVQIVFDPGQVSFILKDGISGGWATKALKENKYRKRRESVMKQRQRDHVFKTHLIPNFAGQETDSWKEAKDMAFDSAYRELKADGSTETQAMVQASEAAKTYDPLLTKQG